MKDDRLYLIHILESVEKIKAYVISGQEDFMTSSLIQDGVIRNFEIIGEAVKRLSPDRREAYPKVPWKRIAGFRDKLIHDYDKVNLREVWNVIQNDLPLLEQAVAAMLESSRG